MNLKTVSVGKNLTSLRRKRGLTQEQLAVQLHVTRQTVSNWESGKSHPDIDTLVRLADILSVSVEHLIYGTDNVSSGKARISNNIGQLCLTLSRVVYVGGLFLGIRNGSGITSPAPDMVGYAFYFKNALPIWIGALLIGTLLLGVSEIIRLLTKEQD